MNQSTTSPIIIFYASHLIVWQRSGSTVNEKILKKINFLIFVHNNNDNNENSIRLNATLRFSGKLYSNILILKNVMSERPNYKEDR